MISGAIIDIRHLLPKHPKKKWSTRDQDDIGGFLLHHSGVAPRNDGRHFDQIVAMANYHIQSKQLSKTGAPGLAYAFVIDPNGAIYKCNALTAITWHAGTSQANSKYIGVMLMGDFEHSKPTAAQLKSLAELIRIVRKAIPTCWRVAGHRDVRHGTVCPGKNFTSEMVDALQLR